MQFPAAIMNWHVPTKAIVLFVCKQLVHKVVERKTTLLEYAGLAVLGEDDVRRMESSC